MHAITVEPISWCTGLWAKVARPTADRGARLLSQVRDCFTAPGQGEVTDSNGWTLILIFGDNVFLCTGDTRGHILLSEEDRNNNPSVV